MNKITIILSVDDIFNRLLTFGHRQYGEEVTELEHALQSAMLANDCGEPHALVAACLLHDYGHLLHDLGEEIAGTGIDARHEMIGAASLASSFPAAVVEPIRLHVAAKRYLYQQDESYFKSLSAASRQSLALQGGPMTEAEIIEFEELEYHQEAIRLRHYDDRAKIQHLVVPPLETYRTMLESLRISPRVHES